MYCVKINSSISIKVRKKPVVSSCLRLQLLAYSKILLYTVFLKVPQAAQALSVNNRNKIWRRIIRVCMGSTRHLWGQLKITILNKNGLPYAIRVLFAPGGAIMPI